MRNFVEADAEESSSEGEEGGGGDAERGSTAGAGSASSRCVRKIIYKFILKIRVLYPGNAKYRKKSIRKSHRKKKVSTGLIDPRHTFRCKKKTICGECVFPKKHNFCRLRYSGLRSGTKYTVSISTTFKGQEVAENHMV